MIAIGTARSKYIGKRKDVHVGLLKHYDVYLRYSIYDLRIAPFTGTILSAAPSVRRTTFIPKKYRESEQKSRAPDVYMNNFLNAQLSFTLSHVGHSKMHIGDRK